MKTASPSGINLIKAWESCRLVVYPDVGGVLTVGYGHVCPDMEIGQHITQDQADEFLRQDLIHVENAINCQVKVPLTQNQFDSLASFTFNCGIGSLHESTLLKRLNAGDYQEAAHWFLPWCRVHGVEVEGLLHRRKAECDLFLRPDHA